MHTRCSARIRTSGWLGVATRPRLPMVPPRRGAFERVGMCLSLGPVLGLGVQTGDVIVGGRALAGRNWPWGGRSPVEPVSAGRPGLGGDMPAGAEKGGGSGEAPVCGVCLSLEWKSEDSCSVFVLKAEPLEEGGLGGAVGGAVGGLPAWSWGAPMGAS